jgi:DNA-directed RNA polymerase specialized sigma24 family protein
MADRRPAPESSRSQFGEISTRRDLLGDAGALLERYGRAIRGYLLVILKDEDAAHDVLLAMRVKMMDGRFARWEPGKGRFRFYLKTAVLNEARQYLRKRRNRRLERQVEDLARFPEGGCGAEPDKIWLGPYRKALLEAATRALRAYQEQHPGNVFHTLVGMLSGDLIADAGAVGDWPGLHASERSPAEATRVAEARGVFGRGGEGDARGSGPGRPGGRVASAGVPRLHRELPAPGQGDS